MKHMALLALGAMAVASVANADIYVHGRNPNNTRPRGFNQNYGYWVNDATGNTDGKQKQAFNWDGSSRIVTNTTIAAQLHAGLPAGANIVRCHSAGCLLALMVLQRGNNAAGGFIGRIVAGGSASGGSELANVSQPEALSFDLQPGTARGSAVTQNISILMHHGGGSKCEAFGVGSWGNVFAAPFVAQTLPGEDDGAVPYHSSLGKAGAGTWCDKDAQWWDPLSAGCQIWSKNLTLKAGGFYQGSGQYTNHVIRKAEYYGHEWSRRYAAQGW